MYNTTFDLNSLTEEEIANAARIQQEIEGEIASNPHLAEERGQRQIQEGDDEEMMYSGVKREADRRPLKNQKKFTAINKKRLEDEGIFTKIDNVISDKVKKGF